jgi:hypothetical protein
MGVSYEPWDRKPEASGLMLMLLHSSGFVEFYILIQAQALISVCKKLTWTV